MLSYANYAFVSNGERYRVKRSSNHHLFVENCTSLAMEMRGISDKLIIASLPLQRRLVEASVLEINFSDRIESTELTHTYPRTCRDSAVWRKLVFSIY